MKNVRSNIGYRLAAFTLMFCMLFTCVFSMDATVYAKAAKNSVKFSKKTITLYAGEQYTVPMKSPTAKKQLKKVKYTTSDKKVAKVAKSGQITAKKKGNAVITAKLGKQQAKLKVKIKKKPKKIYLNLASYDLKLNTGKADKIKVTGLKGVSQKKLIYTSNNSNIAAVDAKGVVTAKAKGTAKITVKSVVNKKVKKTVTVTVTEASGSNDDNTGGGGGGETPEDVTPPGPSVTPQDPSVTPQGPEKPGYTNVAPTPDKDGYVDPSTPTPDKHKHVWTNVTTVKPTCTVWGQSEMHCSLCGARARGIRLAPTGHSYKDDKCTVCGAVKPKYPNESPTPDKDGYIDPDEETPDSHVHSWNDVTLKEPSCIEEGQKDKVCSKCGGKAHGDSIPAKGHNYVDGTCWVCGAVEPEYAFQAPIADESGYIDPDVETPDGHEHDFTDVTVKEPTCEETGKYDRQCSKCGGKARGDEIPALGHLYVDGVCEHCGETSIVADAVLVGGLKDGGTYPTGQLIEEPESGSYLLNGESIVFENGVYYLTEAGDYTLQCVDAKGVKGDSVAFTVEDDAIIEVHEVLYASAYTVGTTISIPKAMSLAVNDRPVKDSYTFERDGDYTLRLIDENGNVTIWTLVVKHMHEYDEPVYSSASTCQVSGVKITKCIKCEATREIQLALADHKFSAPVTTKEPTCAETGISTGTCTVCGKETTNVLPSLGHQYGEYIITDEPECDHSGIKTATCARCGEQKMQTVPSTGHAYGEYKETTAATCTSAGVSTSTCANCGKTKTESIDALGHEFAIEFVTDIEPTCTTDGSKSRHCSRCSVKTEVTPIVAAGHAFGEYITISSPNCVDKGSKQRTCDSCGFVESEDLDALGHDWESEATVDVEATCTTDGSRSIHCSRCDAQKDSEVVEKLEHKYGSWNTVVQATCMQTGVVNRTCALCGDVATATTPVSTTHAWSSTFTVDKEATCTATGSKSRHCTISGCTATTEVTTTAATGHSYPSTYTTTKEATCTAAGSKYRVCSICSNRDTQTIAALGHSYSNTYTVDKAATCVSTGTESKHCTRSGCTAVTGSRTISMLAHDYVWGKCQQCDRLGIGVNCSKYSGCLSISNLSAEGTTISGQLSSTGKHSGTKHNISIAIPHSSKYAADINFDNILLNLISSGRLITSAAGTLTKNTTGYRIDFTDVEVPADNYTYTMYINTTPELSYAQLNHIHSYKMGTCTICNMLGITMSGYGFTAEFPALVYNESTKTLTGYLTVKNSSGDIGFGLTIPCIGYYISGISTDRAIVTITASNGAVVATYTHYVTKTTDSIILNPEMGYLSDGGYNIKIELNK